MTVLGTGSYRRVAALALGLALVAGWFGAWPVALGGRTGYVTTEGASMQPRFHTGDLALVRVADSYRVGDVVAYRSRLFETVVLHRIVAVDGDRYVTQGDNNPWLDPERPTSGDIVGKLAVRVPQGGIWIARATSPVMLALLTFTLLAGGGTALQTRRRRKRETVSDRSSRTSRPSGRMTALPAPLRAAAGVTAAVGVVGATLAVAGWTGPLETLTTTQRQVTHQTAFSYVTRVPPTAAYDGTTVASPDPVFRKLADTVVVHYSYRGGPGDLTVTAELSAPSGWHSTIPLTRKITFPTSRYDGSVQLDLTALDVRRQAAAAATGIPIEELSVAVVPRVETIGGETFAPALRLRLTPLQLTLAGDRDSLTVARSTPSPQRVRTPRTLHLLGGDITAAAARQLSLLLTLAALLAGAVLALLAHRSRPADEAAAIHRRYAPQIVPVHPMPTPPGRAVIDVTEFATLARLADRYGLLILNWSRSDVETFLVQDESTTYRYRTGVGALPPPTDAGTASEGAAVTTGA